ncbi:recombinase family protein [Pelagibius sp. CAU 1746]|uniref:recombinase family protein n=1 Tax=Pelagibius sp. CAU 1746 TaxID=3140370 RepID=UPI00345FB3AC
MFDQVRTSLPEAKRSSYRAICRGLNDLGVPSPTGRKWSDMQVRRTLERIERLKPAE